MGVSNLNILRASLGNIFFWGGGVAYVQNQEIDF